MFVSASTRSTIVKQDSSSFMKRDDDYDIIIQIHQCTATAIASPYGAYSNYNRIGNPRADQSEKEVLNNRRQLRTMAVQSHADKPEIFRDYQLPCLKSQCNK